MSAPESRSALLRRIREGDRSIGAFLCLADDEPLAAGPAADLPLAGLPVAVKDIMDTAAMPTTYGSRAYAGHRPVRDAAIVSMLKDLGAFIVGKTTTTEFATAPPTPTRNPRDPARTPGGSSAGSAAAVAAGLVPAALGTQTLGSVIRPASYCGVVGFKPTYGWFPPAGVKMLAPSLDTIGVLTCDVDHAARLYRALSPGERPTAAPATPRLGFLRAPLWDRASPDAQAAIEDCVERLRSAGLSVTDLVAPDGFGHLDAVAHTIHDHEMRRTLLPDLRAARDKLEPSLVARIEAAAAVTTADYRSALRHAEAQRLAFAGLMGDCDAVLCLSAPGEAPLGLASTGSPAMNASWTALHVPCLSLPVLKGAARMPIGLQLVADRHQDTALLHVGATLERLLTDRK